MRGRRMPISARRLKFHLTALWSLVIITATTSCVYHSPPEIAGERIDAEGAVTEKIIRKTTCVSYPALTPDGRDSMTTYSQHYYFQEGDKPGRKFWIGNSRTNQLMGNFLAVSNSSMWVTFDDTISWTDRPSAAHTVTNEQGESHTSYIANDLHIYVFDDKGFLLHRTFLILQRGEGKLLPESEFPSSGKVDTENGNRTLIFKTPEGLKKYDVPADTLTDAEQAPKSVK